jgi:hypothetical protein
MPGDGLTPRLAPPSARRTSEYRHDGFYLRLAGGLGMRFGSQRSDAPLPTQRRTRTDVPYEGSSSTLAPGTAIAVGLTPARGLVVGVAADTVTIPSADADVADPRTGNYSFLTSQFALISAFADYYVDDEAGFHVQGGMGLATYVSGVGEPQNPDAPRAEAHTALGFGTVLGVGYEWFIGRQWSAGLMMRLLWGKTSGSDPRGGEWTHTTVSPGLMVGLTYH